MTRQELEVELAEKESLQKDLFIRGFLITTRQLRELEAFPFYGNWSVERYGGYFFAAHNLTGKHIYTTPEGKVFFLLGHAYNPFTMEHREREILEYIAEADGTPEYMERIHELTGVFVFGSLQNDRLEYLVDPSGMQSACCGTVDGDFYLSSHAQLIGDICDLQMDPLVKELVEYKWYRRVMGAYLPADLTPFSEIKRIVPSIAYCYREKQIVYKRFWPSENLRPATTEESYQTVIADAAKILRNNLELIARKWPKPWISLTGGIDSNTTFAAANGQYDHFETFSYVSAEKEIPDADAAKTISDAFGVKHHVYHIPQDEQAIADYDLAREIIRHNNGYVAERLGNETRKRIYLKEHANCDVEVKSWTSETIRGYWYKHYGRKSMPALSAKLYRNLYKIFILNRKLAHKVDRLFEKYLADYEYYSVPAAYPPADVHFNEVTWGSWGGLNISEMKYSFDMTVPYNNRKFLDLMFRVPLEKRISDQHHLDMKKILNPELYDMNIRVVNMKETNFRAFALNIIFTINMYLPF